MTLQATSAQEYPLDGYGTAQSLGQGGGDDKLKLVLTAMRGRFRWAILLALALGAMGGYAGFRLGEKTYRSGVPIRVVPVLPKVLYNDEEKGVLPRYESFVETQVALIQSQRVINLAMDSKKWTDVKGERSKEDMLAFMEALIVQRKNELISVFFDDPNPEVAMAGAEAVVAAYKKLYIEEDANNERRRLEILQQLQAAHNNELEGKKQLLASITDEYSGQDIGKLYDAQFTELQRRQGALSELEVQLQLLQAYAQQASQSVEKKELNIDDLATLDAELGDIRRQQLAAEHHLRRLRLQGVGEDHSLMLAAKQDLEFVREQLDARAEVLRKIPPQFLLSGGNKQQHGAPSNPQIVQAQADKMRAMLKEAEDNYRHLGRAHQQSQELREQIAEVRKKLDETRERIDHLGVEASMSGRISVLSNAERPLAPFKDTEKKYAAVGGMGGASLALGFVLALALADPRVRHVEDLKLRLSVDQVLGIVPTLPKDLSDPEQAAIGAHAVHHIRSMLQLRAGDQKTAFAVTSPMSGTGKTSLILALGSSFASAGARTLLIDCDMVGGGLTHRSKVNAHRKAGHLFVKDGLLTTEQLQAVLAQVKRDHRKIGEVVVSGGYATQEQVDQCLMQQGEQLMGLMEALAGEPIINCIARSGVPQMWVLPLGEATPHHATSVSPIAIQKLLATAKQNFDIVLIDTGPIPGSIEASIVASVADEVVMLLSRGEPRPVAEACLQQLRNVGAKLAGVVFNRVNAKDMPMYASSRGSSYNSAKMLAADDTTSVLERIDQSADFGPVARAVVSTVPAGRSKRSVRRGDQPSGSA